MHKFHNEGLYFESVTGASKKHFKVSFPFDAYLSLKWDEEELKALRAFEDSEFISDKLLMLAMIAAKLESKPKPMKEVVHGTKETE